MRLTMGADDGMRFRILGVLDARNEAGRPVRLGAPKPRTLLAVLLLHANQPVGTDRLTDLLWPAGAPRSAAGALRTYASTVRSAVGLGAPAGGPRLVALPPGYLLEVGPDGLDALLFDRLAELGRQAAAGGDLAAAAGHWQHALGLWSGRVLDGIDVDPAGEVVRSGLAERRLGVLEDWAQARLTLGGHAEVLAALPGAAADQPTRERLHGLTMLALYRAGRQAEALAEFRRLRRRLVDELGVEPGRALQLLQRQILAADPELDPPAAPVTIGARDVAVPRQLPPDPPSLVGRTDEIAAIRGLGEPDQARNGPAIVAIDGPGGVGKSTLAIHAAHRLAARFADGQLYVDLQGATAGLRPLEPLEALARFQRALGGTERERATVSEASSVFRAMTAGRRLLVVLDNARDPAQVRHLLPGGTACLVLVTSRQVLTTLDGATHVHVAELSEEEAVLLLGRLAGPRIAADRPAALRVARWCGYLPLALRIAGARLAARPGWPVRALADRLSDAHRRLDELAVAELAVRSSFQVSYQQLDGSADAADRVAADAFARVGLPDGPELSLPAAAALLDLPEPAAERAIERLVDCQLVESPSPGRYRLHDLLRLFARETAAARVPAGDRTAALTRALTWYVASAWAAFRLLRPGDPRSATAAGWARGGMPLSSVERALEWLETERGNLVAAVHQLAATPELDPELATQLARALFAYFHIRGYLGDWIGVNEAARGVARRAGDRVAEAYACKDLGAARELRGQYGEALADLRDGLRLFTEIGDRRGRAACLNNLGAVHDSIGEPALAAEFLAESLAVSRDMRDRHSQAISLNNLGPLHDRLGDHDRALSCLREAMEIFRELGNRRGEGIALAHLAGAYAGRAAYGRAVAHGEASLAILDDLNDPNGRAYAMSKLGVAHRGARRYPAALACLREARRIAEQAGDRRLAATCVRELGVTAFLLGDRERAREHWRAALASFEQLAVADADEVRELLAAGPPPLHGSRPA
jgi:DNA-binding SARP family transcriptional activator